MKTQRRDQRPEKNLGLCCFEATFEGFGSGLFFLNIPSE